MDTSLKYGADAGRSLGLWIKLARAYSTFNKLSVKDIATYGLTQPQFGVLETLGHLGPLTIGELCKKMLVSGGNMTVVLDNLQKEKLIDRVRRVEDRRSTEIRLTEKGEQLFESIFPRHAKFITSVADALSVEDQQTLSELLKKLGHAIHEKCRQNADADLLVASQHNDK